MHIIFKVCWCCLPKITKISLWLLKLQFAKVGTFFWDTLYNLICGNRCICVVVQRSVCSELERENAELKLNSVPAGAFKSRQTIAGLLQQLQKQQQVNVRIAMYHDDMMLNVHYKAKNCTLYFCNTFVKPHCILIIFGTQILTTDVTGCCYHVCV